MKHDDSKAEQSTSGQPCGLSFGTDLDTHEEETAVERVRECRKTTYPWASMALLMTVTVGQRCYIDREWDTTRKHLTLISAVLV